MRLLLIRHGNVQRRYRGLCYGQSDVPLSPIGRFQARRLAWALSKEPVSGVYSSPLRRCLDTANRIAAGRGLNVRVRDAFAEINFGSFELQPFRQLERRSPDIYRRWMSTPWAVAFPEGESYDEFRDRVMAEIGNIERHHRNQTVVLVTHGGVCQLLHALGGDETDLFTVLQRRGQISEIHYSF